VVGGGARRPCPSPGSRGYAAGYGGPAVPRHARVRRQAPHHALPAKERLICRPVPRSGSARAPLLAEPARQRRAEPHPAFGRAELSRSLLESSALQWSANLRFASTSESSILRTPARGGVGTLRLPGTTTHERSAGRGTPGGIEGRARSTRPRRRKHRSDRRERGAWFERAKLSRHPENLRFSETARRGRWSARGLRRCLRGWRGRQYMWCRWEIRYKFEVLFRK
jgi:hypothetical protein